MRAVAELIAVLLLFALGYLIPLPGLDPDAVARVAGPDGGLDQGMARLSIFALGAVPLYAVLSWLEFGRLICPGLVRWQAASDRNAVRLWRVVVVLALALSAMQAQGIAEALQAMGMVDETAGAFVPVAVSCCVGVTALLAWVSGHIRLPCSGAGYWVLLVAPTLLLAPSSFLTTAEMFRIGALSVRDGLTVGVFIAAAVALIVYANLLLAGAGSTRVPSLLSVSALLWPPFLSTTVSNAVMGAYVETWGPHTTGVIMGSKAALELVLVVLFTSLYRRMPVVEGENGRCLPLPVLLTVAGIQVVVCAGRDLAMSHFNWPQIPSGPLLIVLVTVMWACWARLRHRQGMVC